MSKRSYARRVQVMLHIGLDAPVYVPAISLVLLCGAYAQLFMHLPFPSNAMWLEHIYVHTCCVSAVSSDHACLPTFHFLGSHLLARAYLFLPQRCPRADMQ